MLQEYRLAFRQYSNASDYVRDLIRRDQEYQDKREALVKALIAGEQSGIATRSLETIWKEMQASKHLS